MKISKEDIDYMLRLVNSGLKYTKLKVVGQYDKYYIYVLNKSGAMLTSAYAGGVSDVYHTLNVLYLVIREEKTAEIVKERGKRKN